MSTPISRLAEEVRDEYYPVDFDERLDRLTKIVLEMERSLDRIASVDDGPDLADVNYYMQTDLRTVAELSAADVRTARSCLARCQQIVSEGI